MTAEPKDRRSPVEPMTVTEPITPTGRGITPQPDNLDARQDRRSPVRPLAWQRSGDVTDDGKWAIQTEHTFGEPPYRFIMQSPAGFQAWVATTTHDTGWYCGPAAARRRVERLARLFDQASEEGSVRDG